MATRRNILVTGATGKQGRGFIHSLLSDVQDSTEEYHILALTRNIESDPTKSLLEAETEHKDRITPVQGNLDDPASIRSVFESAKADGGIWGVFVVLAYPGLGSKSDKEGKQGMVCKSAMIHRAATDRLATR